MSCCLPIACMRTDTNLIGLEVTYRQKRSTKTDSAQLATGTPENHVEVRATYAQAETRDYAVSQWMVRELYTGTAFALRYVRLSRHYPTSESSHYRPRQTHRRNVLPPRMFSLFTDCLSLSLKVEYGASDGCITTLIPLRVSTAPTLSYCQNGTWITEARFVRLRWHMDVLIA